MYEFAGEYSYDISKWASNLPEAFNAATSDSSATRKLFNYAVGVPLTTVQHEIFKKAARVYGAVYEADEPAYHYVIDADVMIPEGEAEGNLLINSTFDLKYGDYPAGWEYDTVYYTSDYLYIDGSLEQTVEFDYKESLYFGIEYSSDAGFTVEVTTASGTDTISVPASTSFTWYRTSIDADSETATVHINGDCGIRKVYLSATLNEWTHSPYDNPWFMDKCGKAIFYTKDNVRLYEAHKEDYPYLYPMEVEITSDAFYYAYREYSLNDGDKLVLDFKPEDITVNDLLDTIQEQNPTATVSLTWKQHGTSYNSDDNGAALITLPLAYTVSSDTTLSFTLRGRELTNTVSCLLDGEEEIVYLDDRFEDWDDWVDYYGIDGTVSESDGVLTMDVSSPVYVYQSPLPPEDTEPLDFNNVYGFIVSALKKRMFLEWSVSGENVSAEIVDIEGEFFVENAVLAYFHSYSNNKIYLTSESGYSLVDLYIDNDGVCYMIGTQSDDWYLWVSDLNYVHPDQEYIPVFTKMKLTLDDGFSDDGFITFGKYRYNKALHLENSSYSYRINLLYPYITRGPRLYTRYPCDGIVVVKHDDRSSE